MKNIILISEDEKRLILNKHISYGYNTFINEQVVTNYDKVYDYKREGNNFYAKKKGTDKWSQLSGNPLNSVKTNVFKISSDDSKTNISDKTNKNSWLHPTQITDPSKIKQKDNFNITKIGFTTPRVLSQLNYLKQNKQLSDVSFLIVNKKEATVSLFSKNYQLIKKSYITSGRFEDKGSFDPKSGDYENWFNISLDFFEKNPNHSDTKKFNDFLNKNKISFDEIKKMGYKNFRFQYQNLKFPYSYTARTQAELDITPSGIYGLDRGSNVKGFSGSEHARNSFPLIHLETNQKIPPAIHGAAGKNRLDLINKSYNDPKNIKNYTRAGAGCVNVTADFISKILEYDPKYVIILPDEGSIVDNIKITTFKTFSEKIVDLGERCVKSLYDLFPKNVSLNNNV